MSEEKKEIIKHPKDKKEFEQILAGKKPVLVDFFAEWCGPCQMMGPMLDEMIKTYKNIDKVEIVKVDTDKINDVAMDFNIMSVPTFMLFNRKGEAVETMVGMRSTDEFEEKLDRLIAEKIEE